jgi:hypothetical protein
LHLDGSHADVLHGCLACGDVNKGGHLPQAVLHAPAVVADAVHDQCLLQAGEAVKLGQPFISVGAGELADEDRHWVLVPETAIIEVALAICWWCVPVVGHVQDWLFVALVILLQLSIWLVRERGDEMLGGVDRVGRLLRTAALLRRLLLKLRLPTSCAVPLSPALLTRRLGGAATVVAVATEVDAAVI